MIKNLDITAPNNTEKVVACITAQSNSKRLIDSAAEIADQLDAQFHILHINKGDTVFSDENTPVLLENLFKYANDKGGMVHMICSDNIAEGIVKFIKEYSISKIVLGQPVNENVIVRFENQYDNILKMLKSLDVELIMVKRNSEEN